MHKLILFAMCLFCVSCNVGPDYKKTDIYQDSDLSKEFDLPKEAQSRKSWKEQFKDDQLDYLIEIGLNQNTDIKQAISKLKQARINVAISKVTFLPQINLQSDYQYEKASKNIKMSADSKYYSTGFAASWEFDIWGKGRRQVEADTAEVRALEYTLENVKTLIMAEIISNYINLAQNAEKLAIARKNMVLQEKLLSIVSDKYNNGLANISEYSQSRYLLATTKSQIPEYEKQVEIYKNSIALLLNMLPSELPLNVKKLKIISKTNFDNKSFMSGLPAAIIRTRPDVAAAEQRLIAQNALIGKAIAALYPTLDISGLWGYISQGGKSLFKSSSQSYNYEPSAILPLLDWNRLKNEVEMQKEIKEEYFLQYQKTVLQAINELKDAIVSYQSSLKINNHQLIALQNIRQAVASTLKQYEHGLIDFSNVLTIQQNSLSAENDYIEGKSQILQNLVLFYKACGSFYQ